MSSGSWLSQAVARNAKMTVITNIKYADSQGRGV